MRCVILNCSYEPHSRSRVAANVAHDALRGAAVTVDRIELRDLEPAAYPGAAPDPARDEAVARFRAADAYVLTTPIHNWGASSATLAFLAHALDPEDERRFRPFLLIAGAGSARSHLALDGLVRMLQQEVDAVVVGRPLLAAGDDVDRKAGTLRPAVADRIHAAVAVLVAIGRARAGEV